MAAHVAKLEQAYGRELVEHTLGEIDDFTHRLRDAVDSKGNPRRQLSPEEDLFVANELQMCKASFRYWASRYCYINIEGQALGRMNPLLESQTLVLDEIARMELAGFEGRTDDGILYDLLKARQIGGTTLSIAIQAHRTTTQNNIHGLIASDVPDSTGGILEKFELVVDNLPWFLLPKITDRVKGKELAFDGGSHVWAGSGKSTRGTEGQRGQLGRSKTLSVVHLSELSTWEDTKQIPGALMPTIHRSPRILVQFESTAKGRNNFWHKHWKAALAGIGRFRPIFVPWFAETKKYQMPAPPAWSPSRVTLQHAQRCELDGPRWIHKPVRLTRDQLYWYEQTRATFESQNDLATFLEEYAADPEEAFQYAGRGIFNPLTIERVDRMRRPLLAAYRVGPMGGFPEEG